MGAVISSAQWRAALRPALRKTALRWSIGLIVAILNPFEIGQWSSARSVSLWQRLTADQYGTAALPPGTRRAHERITVVYLDDASLEQTKQARPLSAYSLIDLIEDVRLGPGETTLPRAIFVDLLLTDAARKDMSGAQIVGLAGAAKTGCAKRDPAVSPFVCLVGHVARLTNYAAWGRRQQCQASTLAKLDCIRRAKGLPLLFADPRAPDDRTQPSPALDALGTVAATTPVLLDQAHYPLVAPERAADRRGRPFALYPAAALYWLAQAAPGAPPPGCDADRGRRPLPLPCTGRDGQVEWPHAFDRPLAVRWGIGIDGPAERVTETYGGRRLDQTCEPRQTSRWAALRRIATLGLSGVRRATLPRCRYAEAIPAGLFQTDISPTQLRPLLEDRIVLIGAQFADSNDLIEAAPFGEIPGVYYHAMALDNLIEMGPRYPKPARKIVAWLDLTTGDLLGMALALPLIFALAFGRKLIEIVTDKEDDKKVSYLVGLPYRLLALVPLACALVAVRIVNRGSTGFVPLQPNLLSPVVFCIIGLAELLWAAIEPERAIVIGRLRLALARARADFARRRGDHQGGR